MTVTLTQTQGGRINTTHQRENSQSPLLLSASEVLENADYADLNPPTPVRIRGLLLTAYVHLKLLFWGEMLRILQRR